MRHHHHEPDAPACLWLGALCALVAFLIAAYWLGG